MKMPKNRKIYNRSRSRGFTLIELIVVILILAILAAAILPKVTGRQNDAKRSRAASDLANLSQAIQQFRLDVDRYPSTQEGLNGLRQQPSGASGWHGPYIQKDVPPDPWGQEYVYEYPGQNGKESFVLFSYGADGQPGGEGDDADIYEQQ